MHKKFDNKEIEQKWQSKWQESGIYNAGNRDASKEKEYVLVEWPYPSGNLHIGHWHAFAVPDIYVRFMRMHGKQMLYPMGFDAFGLPAENAAIKRNIDPEKWTKSNIEHMRKQLQSMGASFSWDKTTSSTDESYYKWTQWMFTEFFKNDIAYKGEGIVNWCPGCNTVIANEQIINGDECERSGDKIQRKRMPQWMLRITKYADALIEDLDTVDYPEPIKDAQKQWIGRSNGAVIKFDLSTGDTVSVFTTRADTLYGATYLVLAPEHELIEKSSESINNYDEVTSYIVATQRKNEQDRLDISREKTGVQLKGLTAINPATNENIPVFIADYVLFGYGTGAIMGVPAHDERDHAFALKYKINVKQVIEGNAPLPFPYGERLMHSGKFTRMHPDEAKDQIIASVNGEKKNTYRLRDWSVGRQRYWGVPIPIVYDPQGNPHPVPLEHLPWKLPQDVDFKPTGVPPLSKSEELKERTRKIFGEGWSPEVETMDTFLDSSWYFLRYIDNHNQSEASSMEAQRNWMQVDLYFGGAEHTTMHLLYSRFWQKALFDLGYVKDREPYKRRINRGLILGPDGNKMSKSKGNVIDPDAQVALVGADSVKMYLAFMGPYAETANYPWDMGGIAGIRRFLERVYGLSEHIVNAESQEMTKELHKMIEKVTSDVPSFKFNTAISSMMMYINRAEKEGISAPSYEAFLKTLAPFASHLSEELWEQLGKTTSIHQEEFPKANPSLLKDTVVTIGVQINGKMRGRVSIEVDASEESILAQIRTVDMLKKHLVSDVERVFYVKGKIINLMLKP